MKKLLGLLLVAAIAFPASAAVIKNVELKGEVQTIASDTKANVEMPTGAALYNRGAKTRAIAGLSFDVVEDVKANLLFQYVYAWGDHNYTNNGFDNAKGMKLANANLVFSNLFDSLEVTVGRQFYGEDGSPIIYFGANHYNAEGLGYASSLDAAKAVYSNDNLTATFIAGKVADVSAGFFGFYGDPEIGLRGNLFGADVKFNITDALTANVYGYDYNNNAVYDTDVYDDTWGAEVTKNIGVYGAKLGWTTDAFRMSAEYARNFSGHRLVKEPKDVPYMVKADIATDIEAVTLRGTFLYAKTKADWEMPFFQLGNYAPGLLVGHRLSQGVTQSIFTYDVSGIRMFNIGFDYKPADQWTVSLDGFSFQSRDGHHATYEADLTAKYDYNDYVQLFAGLGYAKYGNAEQLLTGLPYKDAIGTENYKGQIGMLVRF